MQLAGGLQMFGDRRRVLLYRPRRRLLDRGGQAPVPLGAIGFQLRFIGDRANQRVAEGVLGARGKPHLIDQLSLEQLIEHRIDPQCDKQFRPEAGADHRRRVQRPPGRGGQPVDARLDGGLYRGRHAHLGDIRTTDIATALSDEHAALHQLSHHLLGEERVSGGPVGDDRRQLGHRRIRTQQLIQQRHGVRICQRGKRYCLGAVHPRQRSAYSGREVISTIDGVRGMTVRKSASIDSLTASIQCASSMT